MARSEAILSGTRAILARIVDRLESETHGDYTAHAILTEEVERIDAVLRELRPPASVAVVPMQCPGQVGS